MDTTAMDETGNRKNNLCRGNIFHKLKLKTMDTTAMDEKWKKEKEELKQRFILLTDQDLLLEESKNEEMLKRLQLKLGKTREELHILLSELLFNSYFNKKSE